MWIELLIFLNVSEIFLCVIQDVNVKTTFTLCRHGLKMFRFRFTPFGKRSQSVTAEVTFPVNFAPAQCDRNGETLCFLRHFKTVPAQCEL